VEYKAFASTAARQGPSPSEATAEACATAICMTILATSEEEMEWMPPAAEPRTIAKFDRDSILRQAFLALHNVAPIIFSRVEPRGELKQNHPQLAGAIQRQERPIKSFPELLPYLRRKLMIVDAGALGGVLAEGIPNILG